MKHRALVILVCSLLACLSAGAQAAEFPGWQALRVIHQEGKPDRMIAADLDGDSHEELIVVNTRHARLDLYRWLPSAKRDKPVKADPTRPNDLPLAPDWSRSELALDELPADVAAVNVTGDASPELLVWFRSVPRIIAYEAHDQGWREALRWDLLPGTPTGRGEMLLSRELAGGRRELLLSCEQGIQCLTLEKGSRPTWLAPREQRSRLDWKLADLDGDGDQDLLEWSAESRQTVRWFECIDGNLLPAQVLHEQSAQAVAALRLPSHQPAELLMLGGTHDGLVRRYRLAHGEESELGRQESLPMPGGAKAVWCGLSLDKRPALVAVDASQPRLRVHELAPSGWLGEQVYPTIGGVRAMAAPLSQSGLLLLWVKDASDLYTSRWQKGRLTFPEEMPAKDPAAQRRILSLETTGTTVWWVQRVGADLDLYSWPEKAEQAELTKFPGVGAKTDKALWLGGKRLLVQQAYAAGAKLIELDGTKLKTTEPAHLAKVDLAEFELYDVGGELKPGRMTDGALQWLAADLHPTDQVMLPEGQRLASYVPAKGGEAWALEQGDGFIDRLKPDSAGVARVASRINPPRGSALRDDPLLGLLLIDQDRIVRLSRGRPVELKLIDSIDSRVGRPSGVKEATIHRLQVTPVLKADEDDVVLCDDRRHQLTVLARTADGLKPLLSWQVFENLAYPYGDDKESEVVEPRLVLGFDADGDGRRELAMLCQDRLVIYMARDDAPEGLKP